MNEGFYGKTYSPKNFFHRNKLLAKSSDYIIAFITEGEKSSGTLHTIKEAHKLNKKIVIVSWIIFPNIYLYMSYRRISYEKCKTDFGQC